MSEALVALVVVPVVGAVVPPVLARWRETTGWPVALVALVVHFALALSLTRTVAATGRTTYAVGGVVPPYGIELAADAFSVPFVLLVSGASLAVLAYSRREGPRSNPFYALYLLLVAGLTGVCVTADAFNLYVFLEISGLAAYALVARASSGAAAVAALKYLLLGTIGATCYLLGVGYAYVATGTLNLADLATRLDPTATTTLAAFAFVAVGLGVKVAVFPLHVWKPAAYQHAPPAVSALLAALMSTVAAYAFVRVLFGGFPAAFLAAVPTARRAVLVGGGVSVLAGSVLAYRQRDVARVLAYSSVAQFGVAVLGVGVATETALFGATVTLLGHAVTKAGLFAAAGVVAVGTGARSVGEYEGLLDAAPWTGGSLVVLALGMVGVPPTVGFVGKWYVALGAARAGAWGVVAVVLVSTLLSLAYFGRLVERVYASSTSTPVPSETASPGARVVVVAAAVLSVVLGLAAAGIASFVEPSLAALLHG